MLNHQQFESFPSPKPKKLNPLPQNPEQQPEDEVVKQGRFPSWLHRKLPKGEGLAKTERTMREGGLHTVCEEARCPNLFECWSKKTATFLIMGKECTRSCGFCDIDFNQSPRPLDANEPQHVAESVRQLGLKHVVLTMVARDDLPDQGASHLVDVIQAIRHINAHATIEVLTSDFQGDSSALELVLAARPEIFNHNLETVRSLTPKVRHKATYERTLWVLDHVKKHSRCLVKSGLMVGLGEQEQEVHQALEDLHQVGCHIVTIGQYLQPNRHKLRVKEFVHPDQFERYASYGKSLGISYMHCGPFVRSSYNAAEVLQEFQSS